MHSDPSFITELYQAGISGYVLKGGPISDLLTALITVKDGREYFTSTAPHNLLPDTFNRGSSEMFIEKIDSLSSREKEVFCMLADGQSIKSIAQKLFISPKTVETHKYKIMTKLNVDSLPKLTKLAIKHKLIKV
jgi:DNA-binding NarL/FixJ family response regulator